MSLCPCGSKKEYNSCCEAFVLGKEVAPTAEALMRSRYAAFTNGSIDYLFDSHHESTRETLDRKEVEIWSKESEWKGLTIKNIEKGSAKDKEGTVEFIASFNLNGTMQNHHEVASFLKESDGKWYFVDGKVQLEPFQRVGEKIGRNDPCSCGSGKKFKKCCG